MAKKIKLVLPLVLLIILGVSFFSAKTISEIGNYSKLINYVGIVRGASQRVIKLETNGMQNDTLMDYVSDILDELVSGKGKYNLKRTRNESFNRELSLLQEEWQAMKEEIARVRDGADQEKLLDLSEEFFVLANDTVFSIEEYSGSRSALLSKRLIGTVILCLLMGVFVIGYSVKRYFELRKTAEILAEQAGRDELTGALNGERFRKDAQTIIDENPGLKFVLQYIDFENFKYINDVFGYENGDRMLKKYAQVMLESLGPKELLARSTADCFMILRTYENKEELLERQKNADQRFLQTSPLANEHTATVVCGFCCIEDVIEQLDVQGLLNRANYAKKTVKNQVNEHYAFYNESIRQKMFTEIKIADLMESALSNKEFLVYFQPKVSPEDGQIRSAEALVRWKNPNGSFYLPGMFIPVFEKNHSIGLLDQYVYEEVCRFLRGRLDAGLTAVPVSVNVSKIRFYTPGFVETYTEIKERHQIPDGFLEIEFTETVACENQEYMIQIVNDLHQNGFLCSLDDFGTGYSSLGMLRDLPIDVLKMDASFFRNSVDMEKDRIIIKGILEMIRRLEIRTVAEGIETAEQVEFLKQCGCDLIQGFYYYRPMPMEEFAEII